jgi:hypothetical protein
MRLKIEKLNQILLPAALAAAIAVLVHAGATTVVRNAAELVPKVGDIVSFDPARAASVDVNARLPVTRADQASCVLDVAAIRQGGGSLVVEARHSDQPRTYRVHWSGTRTSQGADDCGAAADLVVRSNDLDVLALAAGGYGVEHRSLMQMVPWAGASRR